MQKAVFFFVAALSAVPAVAHAQGIGPGAAEGAREGRDRAGTVGAVVGGVVGGVTGGVAGLLGVDQRPRFHEYVVRERVPSYTYDQSVAVGTTLPSSGVTYYDVPSEYGVRDYRYTVVNGHTLLVDPVTHRVVDVLD